MDSTRVGWKWPLRIICQPFRHTVCLVTHRPGQHESLGLSSTSKGARIFWSRRHCRLQDLILGPYAIEGDQINDWKNIPSSPNLRPDFATSWKGTFLLKLHHVNKVTRRHIALNITDFHCFKPWTSISSTGWFNRRTSYPRASSFSTKTLVLSSSTDLPASAT